VTAAVLRRFGGEFVTIADNLDQQFIGVHKQEDRNLSVSNVSKSGLGAKNIPFVDAFPVDVQIRIQSSGTTYRAYLQTNGGRWQRFSINLQAQDIAQITTSFQKTFEDAVAHFGDLKETSVEEREQALRTLAWRGKYVFNSIFSEGAPRETIRRVLSSNATVQITSEAENFFIPWEFLYDGSLEELDYENFWGMKHIISRALILDARSGDNVSPIIHSQLPRIGLMSWDASAASYLEKFEEQGQIELDTLKTLSLSERFVGLQTVDDFLGSEIDILHICSPLFRTKLPEEAYLLVADDFRISVEDFIVNNIILDHNPFVILDGRVIKGDAVNSLNWASLFWNRGARGCLVPEFSVPDWFASAFMEGIYASILSGVPIGTSLVSVRRHFWKEHSSLLGLAYSLYSSPSIRLMSEL
jgi:hypothetical protein